MLNQLDLIKILGNNLDNKHKFSSIDDDLIFICDSIIAIYNPTHNKQVDFIQSPNGKSFSCFDISPCKQYIAAAESTDHNPQIIIFHIETKKYQSFASHKFGIKVIKYSPNGKYIVSLGNQQDKVKIFYSLNLNEFLMKQIYFKVQHQIYQITIFIFYQGLFLYQVNETQLKLISKNKIQKIVNYVCFNEQGNLMATAGNGFIKLWPFQQDGSPILSQVKQDSYVIEGKSAQLNQKFQFKNFVDCCFYKNELFVISEDGILAIINQNRQLEKWMDLKCKQAYSILVTSQRIFCACSDGIMQYQLILRRVFSPEKLEHLCVFPKPPSLGQYNQTQKTDNKSVFADVIAIAFNQNQNRIISLYSDRTLFIWDVQDLKKITVRRSFLSHQKSIKNMSILHFNSSVEGTFFVTGSLDKTAMIWYLGDKELENCIRRNLFCKNLSRIIYNQQDIQKNDSKQENQIISLKCSNDGKWFYKLNLRLAIGDIVGELKIYNLEDFECIKKIEAHEDQITAIDFIEQENNQFMLSGSKDRLVHIFDVNKQFELCEVLDQQFDGITQAKFITNKNKLYLISCSQSVIIYEYKEEQFQVIQVLNIKINDFQQSQDYILMIQDQGLLTFCLESLQTISSMQTPYPNQIMALDSSHSFIALANSSIVSIYKLKNSKLVSQTRVPNATGIFFTIDNQSLIISNQQGLIFQYKLNSQITNRIEKKKQQLGLIAKRFSEILMQSKQFTLNTFWIENELRSLNEKRSNAVQSENQQKICEISESSQDNLILDQTDNKQNYDINNQITVNETKQDETKQEFYQTINDENPTEQINRNTITNSYLSQKLQNSNISISQNNIITSINNSLINNNESKKPQLKTIQENQQPDDSLVCSFSQNFTINDEQDNISQFIKIDNQKNITNFIQEITRDPQFQDVSGLITADQESFINQRLSYQKDKITNFWRKNSQESQSEIKNQIQQINENFQNSFKQLQELQNQIDKLQDKQEQESLNKNLQQSYDLIQENIPYKFNNISKTLEKAAKYSFDQYNEKIIQSINNFK